MKKKIDYLFPYFAVSFLVIAKHVAFSSIAFRTSWPFNCFLLSLHVSADSTICETANFPVVIEGRLYLVFANFNPLITGTAV